MKTSSMRSRIAGSTLLLLLLTTGGLSGQYEAAPEPAGWALLDVTVVQADGTLREGVTLVVRHGVVETLAAGAPVPAGLREISWDDGTLRVYPGFVDGDGGAPLSLPTPDWNDEDSWNPTRAAQNMTPHRRAADFLERRGDDLSRERQAGWVASAVWPGRGPLPGHSSLILHRRDARIPAELVLEPSLGVALSFQGAPGVYPGTLMAVHALLRQSFLDAEHHRISEAAYASDPRGVPAPHRDEDLETLREVVAGEQRVFFRADGAEYVRRVLALADEIGFEPVIVGGGGAGEMAGELATRNVPVLLTTDLDQPNHWDPDADEALTPPAARERDRLVPIYETAARFEEAGVSFGFTSGGEGDIDPLPGVRRYVEWGLSPAAALRALSAGSAELLGMPTLARVEEGMAATFIVTDRDLLDADVGVVWTFVNGKAEEGVRPRAEGEAPEADEDLEVDAVVGRWEGALDVAGRSVDLTLELDEDDGLVVGVARSQGLPDTPLQDVELSGAGLTFSLSAAEIGGEARFDAVVAGDRMTGSGTMSSPQGDFPFSFRFDRIPGGDR